MTHSAAILRDLSAGQSTADSIAGRIGISTPRAETILRGLVADGAVISFPIAINVTDAFTVYRLTPTPETKQEP